MPELGTLGSVRGVASNGHPYRDKWGTSRAPRRSKASKATRAPSLCERRRPAGVEGHITHERIASEAGRPRLARNRCWRSRATAGSREGEAAAEEARSRTASIVPAKRRTKPAVPVAEVVEGRRPVAGSW